MSNHAPTRAPDVGVIAHPPERRHCRSSIPAQAGHGCTCCCCCCLHALGGVIGAAVAPNLGRGNTTEPRSYLPLTTYWEETYEPAAWAPSAGDPHAVSRGRDAVTAQGRFSPRTPGNALPASKADSDIALHRSGPSGVKIFWWTLLVLVVGGLLLSVLSGREGLIVGGIIIALILPILQLGAAMVAVVVVAVAGGSTRRYQLWQLAKLVLGVVVGSGLGILIMWGLYLLMTRR